MHVCPPRRRGAASQGRGGSARVIGLTQIADRCVPLANRSATVRGGTRVADGRRPTTGTRSSVRVGRSRPPGRVIHRDLSGVLVGIPHEIIPTAPPRCATLTDAAQVDAQSRAVLRLLLNNHSRFGHRRRHRGLHAVPRRRQAVSCRGIGTRRGHVGRRQRQRTALN